MDDYFGDYLSGLSAMAAQQGAAGALRGRAAVCLCHPQLQGSLQCCRLYFCARWQLVGGEELQKGVPGPWAAPLAAAGRTGAVFGLRRCQRGSLAAARNAGVACRRSAVQPDAGRIELAHLGCPSPFVAATTHRSSDGPCPSDSCTPPSSGTGTATAVAITAGGGSAGAPPPQLLHPQAMPGSMPQQAQPGVAWPVQMMPGGLAGVPHMHPQLGMVQLVPVPAGMPLGMVAHMAKQPAANHHNGQNGKPKASSQRQATNREAQKRYRWGREGGGWFAVRLHGHGQLLLHGRRRCVAAAAGCDCNCSGQRKCANAVQHAG